MPEGKHEAATKASLLSSGLYDALKWIALILLPGLNTLYLALAPVWNLPEPEKVALTVAAVDAFLGLLLKLDKNKYDNEVERIEAVEAAKPVPTDGDLKLFNNREMPFLVELNDVPEKLADKDTVTFKVLPQ